MQQKVSQCLGSRSTQYTVWKNLLLNWWIVIHIHTNVLIWVINEIKSSCEGAVFRSDLVPVYTKTHILSLPSQSIKVGSSSNRPFLILKQGEGQVKYSQNREIRTRLVLDYIYTNLIYKASPLFTNDIKF